MKKKYFSLCALICLVTASAYAQYDTLHYFKNTDGNGPRCDLLLSGSVLYGTTTSGGSHGEGCVFSVETNGTGYTDLYDFNGPSGSYSYGSLTLSGNELFGTTGYGGSAGYGTIFSVKTNGSRFLVLHNCTGGTTGTTPEGLMVLSGSTLYGITTNGGTSGYGNIFSMDTNGSAYTDLFDFSGTNGAYPAYGLTLSGGVLYGTAAYGGPGWTGPYTGNGVIFSINTNGSGYTVLLNFNGIDGTNPGGPLAIAGNVIYGTAGAGGAFSDGLVYSIKTNGGSYKDLMDFDGSDGSLSIGGLKLSGKQLFGMTTTGGANDSGAIFSIDTNGSKFKKLLDFNGRYSPDGKFPYNALTLSGGMLYGVTYTGGEKDYGVVFSFDTVLYVTTSDTTIKCNGGGTGNATAYAIGGSAPYTYSWTPSGGTNAIASNLTAGVYTITVTDMYGNIATASVNISQPAPISTSFNVTEVSCYGGNNGSSSVIVSGGTSPYTYSWTGGRTTITISALTVGVYTIQVRDNNGCSMDTTSYITQPPALTATRYSLPQHGPCNGVASVTPSGGTAPYTYLWITGSQTTDTINGQCAGIYCCMISDSNGCTLSICDTVKLLTGEDNLSNIPGISIYPDPNNGYFTVAGVMRGQTVELYNYLGEKLSNTLVTNPTVSFDISGKTNGIYLIRIVDKNGNLVTQKKIVKTE